jgi:hypothetical protein
MRVVEVDRPERPARRGGVKSDDIQSAVMYLGES